MFSKKSALKKTFQDLFNIVKYVTVIKKLFIDILSVKIIVRVFRFFRWYNFSQRARKNRHWIELFETFRMIYHM